MTPEERLTRIENDIDKHNDAIRGLIVVARTCLDSIKELRDDHKEITENIDKLREAQSATDEKLNIIVEHEEVLDRIVKSLAETVDRILGKDNGQK
jgi:uncharacterized coiled-coil DUF342 family protein